MTNQEEMIKNFWINLIEMLRKQGLPFLMLAAAVWYFHAETQKMEAKISSCNSKLVQIYQAQHEEFIELLGKISNQLEK